MSESKDTTDKTLRVPRKKSTLSLERTVESGHVRQNFSHGRSKSVVVERKKRRTIAAPNAAASAEAEAPAKVEETQQKSTRPLVAKAVPPAPSDGGKSGLSDAERDARQKALEAAKVRDVEQDRIAQEEAAKRAQEEIERKKREAEEAARLALEEAERQQREIEEAKRLAAEAAAEADAAQAAEEKSSGTSRSAAQRANAQRVPPKTDRQQMEAEEARGRVDARGKKSAKPARGAARQGDDRRLRGKLTITNAFDDQQRQRSLASLRRKRERERARASGVVQAREKLVREVVIPESITIQELANRMTERAVDVIKFLMKQGDMHKMNDIVDADTAELIVEEFGHTPKRVSEADVEEGFIGTDDDEGDLLPRAPVVTIMGHVDHGKTSLLDAIRETNVVSGEAGGITQHIGAYQVSTQDGHKITFIDTPGHEAFSAMRARGAGVTDIVVLVVAADDGVMPQTVEAINHAKAAEVPLIVAINKIDRPNADPNRVRTDLLQHEVIVESMSGETLEFEVSALEKLNLDKLLEGIALQAELLDLRANPDRSAEGVVVEAKLERGRGPVGTVLIQRGTLAVGNIVVAGSAWGRVRALIDDHGENVATAGPSVPVEVLGFNSAPAAGDQFAVVESEARAREITEYRERKRRDALGASASSGPVRSLEDMMSQLQEAGKQEFPLLIKGDVQGSVEAINGALTKLGTDEVAAQIVHSGVGGITESDISLAAASGAVVMGFNVRANVQASQAAEREGVEIRYYNIIYDLVDDVKNAMSGLLAPTIRENFLGNAEILEVFNISKVGKVAGCRISEGKVERGASVRLIRDNVVIHEGKLSTLKRFKDEVREVAVGQECGMAFENYQDMRPGDVIECFNQESVERSL